MQIIYMLLQHCLIVVFYPSSFPGNIVHFTLFLLVTDVYLQADKLANGLFDN